MPNSVAHGAWPGNSVASDGRLLSVQFALLMVFALLVRVVLFNGPFGSDDVVYFSRASEIANGTWSSANYNGSLRYGFNIPAGLFVYLFGQNYFAANLWSLTCSLGEVGLVYFFAKRFWDDRAALFSALIVASLPLHVAVATRIHTDPIVSFMLSLAFVLLYLGHDSGRRVLYFWSGIALGAVFWVKELVAVTFLAFLIFPLIWRRIDKGWLALASGALLMLALHFVLMFVIAGDPFHLFRVVLSAVKSKFIEAGQGEDGPFYYFRYLFVDVQHIGLLGLWCVLSVVLVRRLVGPQNKGDFDAAVFVLAWAGSLIAVLSWFPVSLSPLRFAMKQSNYLTLFLAPLCLLAGLFLARIPKRMGNLLLSFTVLSGLGLAMLEQADYRVFSSNSKAAAAYAQEHPEAHFVGSSNNSNYAAYTPIFEAGKAGESPITSFWEVATGVKTLANPVEEAKPLYAIVDLQTANWSARNVVVSTPRACWIKVAELTPADLALGNAIVEASIKVLDLVPHPVTQSVKAKMWTLATPAPATVYRVEGSDVWCGTPP